SRRAGNGLRDDRVRRPAVFDQRELELLHRSSTPGSEGTDGSGGWGWNNSANAPVTSLAVGKPAAFTVTVLQPSSVPFGGSPTLTITLTYSSQDFSLNTTDSRGNPGTNPF